MSPTTRPESWTSLNLLTPCSITAPGAFFKAHKDTPQLEGMFGSLVVVFLTRHKGGSLLLYHRQEEHQFDSAKVIAAQAAPAVTYVAFFSDVEHEVTLVTVGHRVALAYNLHFGSRNGDEVPNNGLGTTIVQSNESTFCAALTDLLSSDTLMPDGDKLGFGLSHQYAFARQHSSAVTPTQRERARR